jgi:hypothetical protein
MLLKSPPSLSEYHPARPVGAASPADEEAAGWIAPGQAEAIEDVRAGDQQRLPEPALDPLIADDRPNSEASC